MKKMRSFFSIMLIFSIAAFSPLFYTKDIQTVQAASSVHISNKSYTLALGRYKTLKVYGTSGKVSWRSSNSWIASVSSNGKVTANAPGIATITATVGGKKLTCKITVIRINKYSLNLSPGKSSQLSIIGTNSDVEWVSSNKSVATVSESGKVTAKKPGTATITAYVAGKEISSKVTVIGISADSIVLELGGWSGYVDELNIEGTKSKVTWSSSDKSIATVDKNGFVTSKGPGTAVITATVNGLKFTCKVKVLKINTKEFTVSLGQTKKLKIYGTNSKIDWHSHNTDIVTLSSDGTAKAVGTGSATITGYVDGKKVSTTIHVK